MRVGVTGPLCQSRRWKRGCLAGMPRSMRMVLSSRGRVTRAPPLRCDSMTAKINSVLARAALTPPRGGSPVSREWTRSSTSVSVGLFHS